jgi:hypothetical protein
LASSEKKVLILYPCDRLSSLSCLEEKLMEEDELVVVTLPSCSTSLIPPFIECPPLMLPLGGRAGGAGETTTADEEWWGISLLRYPTQSATSLLHCFSVWEKKSLENISKGKMGMMRQWQH